MQVMQWMVEGGIYPSMRMYHDILSFAQKSAGSEYGTMLREWIGKLAQERGSYCISFLFYYYFLPSCILRDLSRKLCATTAYVSR